MDDVANFLAQATDHDATRRLLATVVLLALIVLLRGVLVRAVTGSDLPAVRRNALLVQIRNGSIVLFLGGAAIVWAQQLQTVALSLAALGVALVIATKELIQCLSGALVRLSAQGGFSLGDRIEIDGIRGDVIDFSALTTTVLEVGPGTSIHKVTGRTVVFPNSIFLTKPVINETFTDDFVLHATVVTLGADDDYLRAEAALLAAATTACEQFIGDAKRNMERIGRKHGLEPPDVRPRVWIRLPDPEHVELIVRFPAPARIRGRVEQAILRAYLQDHRGPAPKLAPRPEVPAP